MKKIISIFASGLTFKLAACSLQLAATLLLLSPCSLATAQQSDDLEFNLDIATVKTIPLPKIFKPNIDVSGRGSHRDQTWPQAVANKDVLDTWGRDIGFKGVYRLQYNLWEINQLSKEKDAQNQLVDNYESILKKVTDAGGVVILDIFGTPAGLGKILDKKSPPWDYKAFKELVKGVIRELSCNKRYAIWYEVWNAPDLEDFFLGREQEYLALYRVVAEAVQELKEETKIYIPVGGPSVSWWFQSLEGNTILTPEKSLIYQLIKFCSRYSLPLDFITWHAYSSDPAQDKENTAYNKNAASLIRDWLSYFKFDKTLPLIIDEWNYDRSANVLPERTEYSSIAASYIPARLKQMYEAGLDYQAYYCLEDFKSNKEGVVRNVGIFSFDSRGAERQGSAKSIYNVFNMLSRLGKEMFLAKLNNEFAGVIPTRSDDEIVLLVYNYIDPEIIMHYLSRGIANLNAAERKFLLSIIHSEKLEKIALGQVDIAALRTTQKVKGILKKAVDLKARAQKFETTPRTVKLTLKNLKGNYLLKKYKIDSACSLNCDFVPVEEKEVDSPDVYQETLILDPYSVQMLIFQKRPPEAVADANAAEPSAALNPIADESNASSAKE